MPSGRLADNEIEKMQRSIKFKVPSTLSVSSDQWSSDAKNKRDITAGLWSRERVADIVSTCLQLPNWLDDILLKYFITKSWILTLSLILTIKRTLKLNLTLKYPLILTRKEQKIIDKNYVRSGWEMETKHWPEILATG